MITSRQIRAGRALLGWSRQFLADRAVVSLSTVQRLEEGKSDRRVSSIERIRKALEAAGVEFSNRGDDGVRIKP
ncbi:helix-turn-helix domain-containing protein [Azospirillum agricola]|uniref:helix-turn-helix domain-containing protein n=1 Tax=Azospirillum agricola TaxID=1720247 RepID=UPI001AE8E54B|nr:helix-turn-helix domain-containing protein [Azospirillum agricola]